MIPEVEPIATYLSIPGAMDLFVLVLVSSFFALAPLLSFLMVLFLPQIPPRARTVMPTAPSSSQRTIGCRRSISHSVTSPFLPAMLMPELSRHQQKSAMPPRLSMQTSCVHCRVSASKIFMVPPPPLRVVPRSARCWPDGEIRNRSMLRCAF